jgi:alcohol dehydrogenase class IV
MSQIYSFSTAAKIVAGAGCLNALAEHLQALPGVKSALVLTQPNLVEAGLLRPVFSQLDGAGIACRTLTGVMPEPTADNITELAAEARKAPVDVIIGAGGGSVLDAAKILSVMLTNDQRVEEMLGIGLVRGPGLPTVLVPTTAGTGSEATPNAIVTIPSEELKIGIVSPHLLPRLVLLDAAITVGLPPAITAATGMDAFIHAFESFISNKANPFSDMFALEAMRLITRSIQLAYGDGANLAAREDMLLGALYGGMALTCAGTAAVHALAYPLGGKFHIPHGVANSMLLPHVTQFNRDAIESRLLLVAQAMGLAGATPATAADAVVARLHGLIRELAIPQDLTAFGVKAGDVEALTASALKVTRLLANNPKPLTAQDVAAIYRRLLP